MVVNYFGMDEDKCSVEDAKNGRSQRRQSKWEFRAEEF